MLRKSLFIIITTLVLVIMGYFTFLYYATYSEGVRSGELIKFSHKGMIFKTWEGEISQGISGAQIFSFSIMDSEKKVISDFKEMEGQYVKITYIERYKTFPWWGDSKYFITAVKKDVSPFKLK
ncbi:6-phosphogluconate dehydrogenase [Flavobacterium psychrophilum]|uniref:6-phosphogluconate dehydrogenase n=2 Tax=Flavobacterium psychrophilum TaxID=96345 RepID=A6H131_FLAPJ|nr:6-phosphogluconate dehydrogenase [Flavobacterium psychrophilum]AIG30740.1 6-phosphogluconate dehydrogenase [Flavobacterium psychrophilum]AIG33014.1 6-phosphogluconate dehydrogenase [Flavobacterium psychrophilum]AIG35170.1 6-phosphogluconate dehydrogenase [Flavobacterium psychrophilum]AIG37534.1 6-phosphogluconate dehydrogenase [Flavobacterium psychrophilum]AIG39799.1 6-phosphogluconate dehydrogenase [Flavobacterium psychrophilum]